MVAIQKKKGERVLESLKERTVYEYAKHGKKPRKIKIWACDYDALKAILESPEDGKLIYDDVMLVCLDKSAVNRDKRGMVFANGE